MTKPLQNAMPRVSEFIHALRENPFFGTKTVNDAIRAGLRGQPTFWASEGGHEIGTRSPVDPDRNVCLTEMQVGDWREKTAP